MKSNLSAYRPWFMALGLAVAALGATWWLPDRGGRDDTGNPFHGPDGAGAQRGHPGPEAATGQPARRLRASSTMPYFSFAQSLRSRS